MFSSEDTSTVMTRDEYATDSDGANPVLDSYDDNRAAVGADAPERVEGNCNPPVCRGHDGLDGF
jgi:hypothetical protein